MKNNGGPAFPIPVAVAGTGDVYTPSIDDYGMTLRDYFAAAALRGMLCNGFIPDQVAQNRDGRFNYTIAAFDIADAMLEAREK